MPAFMYLGGDHGRGLLLSALAQPAQTFGGRYVYRTVFDKGAALVVSLIENHPFVDGNKRMGMATLNLFCIFNYYFILSSTQDTVQFALDIASEKIRQRQAASWLRRHSMSVMSVQQMAEAQLPLPEHLKSQTDALITLHEMIVRLERRAEASS